jgi:uncharacterized protein (DUF488 family)
MTMCLYTIGFTQKSARDFFGRLQASQVKRVLDVRLNNSSQLAGFAKKDDLQYFLREICDIDYVHLPILAPTSEMLERYRKKGGGWKRYEEEFLRLIEEREIEKQLDPKMVAGGCLLCSEDKPHQCHRRLVAEYLREKWGKLEIKHL